MRRLAWVLLLFYVLITVLWLANSSYLFSISGVSVWLLSIMLGFVAYKKLNASKILRKLIFYSSTFMVFLVLITSLIHFTVTSMP